jgi:hypothetical protein
MIIFVLHHLYSFFKETLTVPKIKDMVKRPQQKYDVLFRELRNQVVEQPTFSNANANSNDDMKNELKRYLMDLNSSSHAPQSQPQLQPQFQQPQFPQPHPQFPQPHPQSDFIEFGSTYK